MASMQWFPRLIDTSNSIRRCRRGAGLNGWLTNGVAGVSCMLALAACDESSRTFGDPTRLGEDGGANGARGDGGETNATTAPPDAGESLGSDDQTATLDVDGGPECTTVVCPADTECRTYLAPECGASAEATACSASNVTADTPCDSGNGACNGEGECVVPNLAVLGSSCERDDQCGSHHCAVGTEGETICCDSACDDPCTTCSAEGHCDVTPATDLACGALSCEPGNACVAFPPDVDAATCATFGVCDTTDTYCTPEFARPDETCGDGLVCDGRGACVFDCPDPGPNRVCTVECPCETGEGSCDDDEQCAPGFVCTSDAEAKLGFPGASCMPAHCVNDEMDAEETSTDCGGGCGCRATYEVVEITGVPADAGFGMLAAMSGDGSTFCGNIGRAGDRFSPSYPARIDANGVVTELDGLGVNGNAFGINTDGSVIVGDLFCSDPPDCTTAEYYHAFRWIGDEPPTSLLYKGSAKLVSQTGAVVAGTQYDPVSGTDLAFRASVNRYLDIPELDNVIAMSNDGEYIAGHSSSADVGALWSYTLEGLVDLYPPTEWLSWGIDAMSDDGATFTGSAYVDGTTVKPAFIWHNGAFAEFPKLPGADYNVVEAMSADGSVVVGLSGTNSVQRAFIWDSSSGIRTVLSEAAARGLELPVDLELTTVDFLSDDGTILVGWVYGIDARSFWRIRLLP